VATQAAAGAAHVCQLAAESTCTTTCAGAGQVCSADSQCRTACTSAAGCASGDFCVLSGAAGACYQPSNPADEPVLIADGYIAADGAVLDGALLSDGATSATVDGNAEGSALGGDASPGDAVSPSADGSTDSTVTDGPGSSPADGSLSPDGSPVDASVPSCGDAAVAPDGACDYCPKNACAHGTCVSANGDYSCQCYTGYTGSGTKACTVLDSCLANNGCNPAYPCQPTAPPGQACLGQFAEWPMSDPGAVAGGPAAGGATQPPSFSTDTASGTVTDQVSGLIWQLVSPVGGCSAADAAASCTLSDAVAYCASLTLAGSSDWRVPTKIELETLLDYSHAQPPYIANAFLPTQASISTVATSYWTASALEEDLAYNWYVEFLSANGSSTWAGAGGSLGSVRCVRGTGISPTTAAAHYTILAGAIDAGVAEASVTGDVVADNWTGLSWERMTPTNQMNLADADSYCAGLGSGFRLPTLKELLTLVDPTAYSPSIDTMTFPATPTDQYYWSSTLNEPNNGYGFGVRFDYGETSSSLNGVSGYYVRCVH
jgi:hypothetical protein